MAGDPRFIGRYRRPDVNTRRGLANTIGGCLAFVGDTGRYHDPKHPGASSRAALVLSTVGCAWHDRSGLFG